MRPTTVSEPRMASGCGLVVLHFAVGSLAEIYWGLCAPRYREGRGFVPRPSTVVGLLYLLTEALP